MLRKDVSKPFLTSLNPQERAKFDATAAEWRNPNGAYRVVHAFNKARLSWLFGWLHDHLPNQGLHGVKVLDVGSATGLVSEAFCRQGATVTGIDVSGRNIALAEACAQESELPITYHLVTPEQLAADNPQGYQIVLALEVVEHVQNIALFLNGVFHCASPGGTVVIATLNRTWRSWLIGIIMAEYILRWLPKGTHAWANFMRPSELDVAAARHGFTRVAQTGFTFNPLSWRWVALSSLSINYMLVFRGTGNVVLPQQ